MARIKLLEADDMPEEHQSLARHLEASSSFINLYRGLAHAPVALERFYAFASSLWSGDLPARLIEVAILSVTSTSKAPYPLAWHVGDGLDAGLTTEEVRALVDNDEARLGKQEALIARFAREVTQSCAVSDETYAAVASFLSDKQLVELTLLAGFYRLISAAANTLMIDLDEQAEVSRRRLPKSE